MSDEKPTQPIDWKVKESAEKAEQQKLRHSFHELEKTRNKSRLLYPPDELGSVTQLHYDKERRS